MACRFSFYRTIAGLLLISSGLANAKSKPTFKRDPKVWEELRRLPASTERGIRLRLPKSMKTVERVVYGAPTYGYFEAKHYRVVDGKLQFRMIPPGYRHPISVFVSHSKTGQLLKLQDIQPKSPFPAAFESIQIKKTKAGFSSRFFLLGGALPKESLMDLKRVHVQGKPPLKSSNRFSFLMIVNRIGELVWVYVPAIEDQPFYSYINAQQVSPGEYGFVLGKKDGYFAVIDHLGNHTKRFISRQKSIDLPMHHDFILDDQQNHLVTISNGMSKIMEKGVEVSYLTNNIVKVNLATRKWKELIDFAKYFPVGKDPFWNENKQKDRFVGWGEESADHDYIHANSLNRVTNEGVLTALKHLDRVVMLSSDFSSVQWVAGPSPEDDFRVTGKARFSHPHSPWLRENNRLIMFDNGFRTRKSRLLEVQLDKSKKEAIFNWEWYPPEKLFSSNRSSVLPISDRRLLAYFVSPKRNGKTESKDREHDYLYEIEYPSGRIAASMKLSYPVPSAGFHALPINAIGEDQPYRGKLPRNP